MHNYCYRNHQTKAVKNLLLSGCYHLILPPVVETKIKEQVRKVALILDLSQFFVIKRKELTIEYAYIHVGHSITGTTIL